MSEEEELSRGGNNDFYVVMAVQTHSLLIFINEWTSKESILPFDYPESILLGQYGIKKTIS